MAASSLHQITFKITFFFLAFVTYVAAAPLESISFSSAVDRRAVYDSRAHRAPYAVSSLHTSGTRTDIGRRHVWYEHREKSHLLDIAHRHQLQTLLGFCIGIFGVSTLVVMSMINRRRERRHGEIALSDDKCAAPAC